LSLKYGLEQSDRVGMENILQTLSLLGIWECPAIVVHLVWSCLQPERGIIHFKMLLDRLIARKLVDNSYMGMWSNEIFLQDSWEFEGLRLLELVQEYVSVKLHAIILQLTFAIFLRREVKNCSRKEKKFFLPHFYQYVGQGIPI